MARIDRAARPTRLTAADHARQRAAVAEWDRRAASALRRERVARLIYWGAVICVGIGIFYGVTK